MNPRVVIPTLSLAINVVLVAALAHNHAPSQSAPKDTSPSVTNTALAPLQPLTVPATSTVPRSLEGSAFAFRWAQLESTDYAEYMKRLRAFGVPEQNVRDIIIADVKKQFRPRFAAIRLSRSSSTNAPASTNFWNRPVRWMAEDTDLSKTQRAQLFALQQEQDTLIKSLLGWDVFRQTAAESSFPTWREYNVGPFPPEKQEELITLRQRFDAERTEIYQKADGYIDQDTQVELKKLAARQREEFAKILTPQEIVEYELRNSEVANQMRWSLNGLEPNEQEFRAIFAYKQAMEALKLPVEEIDPDDPDATEIAAASEVRQKAVNDSLAQALGPDRLKQFQLSDDWSYRNLLESGVPMSSVVKVADIKEEVENAANKIRMDPALNDEQRTQALKDVRNQTKKALAELLGERRANAYPGNGGWWLNNIAPGN